MGRRLSLRNYRCFVRVSRIQKSTKAKKRIPRHEWNSSKPMWVIGTIDSYGAIRARSGECPMHGVGDGNGRRWRWNVWGGEFHSVMGNRNDLTGEEQVAVEDWLEKHGYIYPTNVF